MQSLKPAGNLFSIVLSGLGEKHLINTKNFFSSEVKVRGRAVTTGPDDGRPRKISLDPMAKDVKTRSPSLGTITNKESPKSRAITFSHVSSDFIFHGGRQKDKDTDVRGVDDINVQMKTGEERVSEI